MMWHNTKTDPPKGSGQYAVAFRKSLCCPWQKYTYLDGEWRNENGMIVANNDPYYPAWWMEIVEPDDEEQTTSTFNVGDRVRVIDGSRFGQRCLPKGAIGTIAFIGDRAGRYVVFFYDHVQYFLNGSSSHLFTLSDREIEVIKDARD